MAGTLPPMTAIAAPAPAAAAPAAAARFSRRLQALAIDALVHGTTLVVVMSLLELLDGPPLGGAVLAGWLGLVLLYEPLLVSRRGATLGHAMAELRVVDVETAGNPNLARAFARHWIKLTAGFLAIGFMLVSGRPRALHDLAAGTRVEERSRTNQESGNG